MALTIIILLALLRHLGSWPAAASRSPRFTEEPASGDASLLGVLVTPEQPAKAMPPIGEDAARAFFRRFAPVAVSERKKYGVPAAVTLAYAFSNSHAGQKMPAQQANNYFSLPCTSDWEGDTFEQEGVCFRRYETAWESFRDFSVFMSSQEWYGAVRRQSGKDWRGWVKALERNSGPTAAHTMQAVIEQYGLDELDR
ncbi:MAG: glucosaminidase domain-containing protein [Saprospiraceae bacterium]|nr:glucosaminidase domain-containing protein [Saprospiraceae bacterium]